MTTPPVCNYEGSDYQSSFWDAGGRAYEDMAEALALRHLLPKSGRHLLELGAGAGRNTPRYAGFERVTLLDYAASQLQQARQRLGDNPRYRYVAADVYRLPFVPAVFDAATMIRTLHHLAQPQIALQQVRECLADGSVFILEFANKRNIKALVRYVGGRQKWNPFSPEAIEFVPLNFDFHPKSVRRLLTEAGFNIEAQRSVSYLRAGLFKRLPLGLLKAKERVLQAAFSWTAYSPSVFLRTLVPGQPQPLNEAAFFRCPACGHHPLPDTPPQITCGACGRIYPVRDGIYDFRTDQK